METLDLKFTLFGGFKLGGAPLDPAQMEKAELLAYLLCCNGEASKEAICRDLWDTSPTIAFINLEIELLYLRSCLRELSRNADGEMVSRERLSEQQDRVLLRYTDSDVGQFLNCLAQASKTICKRDKLRGYEEAVCLYTNGVTSRGPLLQGGTWPWIARMSKTLDEKYAVANEIATRLRAHLESEQGQGVPTPRSGLSIHTSRFESEQIPELPVLSRPTDTLDKTVVFKDVERSTVLWERYGDRFKTVWKAHDLLLRELAATWQIECVNRWGDSYYFAFDRPETAIEFCVEAQRIVLRTDWQAYLPEIPLLKNRIGIHTGEVDRVESVHSDTPDYINTTVNQAARITHGAMGGQILISGTTYDLVKDKRFAKSYDDIRFHSLGSHELKGISYKVDIWHVCHDDVQPVSELIYADRIRGQHGEGLRTRAEAEEQAKQIIAKWLTRAAVTAWIPGSSIAFVAGNVLMVREVANTFGIYDIDNEAIKVHLTSLGFSLGGNVLVGELAGLLPGPGWAIKIALKTGKAKLLGELLIKYYQVRSPLPD